MTTLRHLHALQEMATAAPAPAYAALYIRVSTSSTWRPASLPAQPASTAIIPGRENYLLRSLQLLLIILSGYTDRSHPVAVFVLSRVEQFRYMSGQAQRFQTTQ